MKEHLLKLIRLHFNATSIERIQRLIVLAVKQDAGTATMMEIMELHIIQVIRMQNGEIREAGTNS